MALSKDLINQFVKLTTPEQQPTETTVNGTYKKVGNVEYVQIDGSDILTPVESTVTADNDDRVQVLIKNHKAIITGNITSPSARHKDVSTIKDEVDEFGNTIKQMDNTITQQNNSIIQIDNNLKQVNNTILQHDNVINQQGNAILQMNNAIEQQGNDITQIGNKIDQQGDQITSLNNTVTAQGNTINQFDNRITQQDNTITQQGNIITEQGNKINLFDSNIEILNSAFKIKDGVLTGLSEIIVEELETNTLNAKYANIDFTNINYAAIEKVFSESGIIKDLIVSEGKITGELVGVTIKGDLIEGNTIKADKLVVKGEDGLYYKLNMDSLGEPTVSKDEKYQNGLDGSVIIAKSIVAEKVAVDDLVAFGATIGGFNIDTHSIFSGAKSSINNTTRGIYMDDQGQINIGDSNNFFKYFKDSDGAYKLIISAGSIELGGSGKTVEDEINDIKDTTKKTVKTVQVLYALSTSEVVGPTTGWSETAPQWESGKYMWQKTIVTYVDNTTLESETCIQGAKGDQGIPGTNGTNGKTSYLHIAYANSANGQNGFSVSDATNKLYIGQYTDFTQADSTDPTKYSWTKIKGDQGVKGDTGNGIKSTAITYQSSTSGTTIPTGTWDTTIPTVAAGSFLWTKTLITYTNNSTSTSYSVAKMGSTGAKGDTGATGKGVKSAATTYQAAATGTTIPTGTWSTSVPKTTAALPYLWSRTITTYTDNSTSTAYAVGSTPEGITVGARNLLLRTRTQELKIGDTVINYQASVVVDNDNFSGCNIFKSSGAFADIGFNLGYRIKDGTLKVNDVVTYSIYAKTDDNVKRELRFYSSGGKNTYYNGTHVKSDKYDYYILDSYGWTRYYITFIITQAMINDVNAGQAINTRIECSTSCTTDKYIYWAAPKLEFGNKPTDWSPAPEDTNAELDKKASNESLENERNKLQEALNAANQRIDSINAVIQSLTSSGANESVLTQTPDGWKFNMTKFNNAINANQEAIAKETTNRQAGDNNNAALINKVNGHVTKIENGQEVSYVNIGTDADNNPCVLLGKNGGTDNQFRVSISNKEIQFLKDAGNGNYTKIAYIDGSTFYGDNITAVKRLQVGIAPNNYYWEVRSNGNLGLNYKTN